MSRFRPTEQMEAWLAPLAETGVAAYYVGGCVRDWLMGRRLADIDLVAAAEIWRLGQAIADRMEAHLFWLREEEGAARILKPGTAGLQIDLLPLLLPIDEDLRARDFTVNAMAVPLAAGLREGSPVLDPTGGRADLARRQLRLVGTETLERDPLRLMRAVRLSEQLRFSLEPRTEARVRAEAASLARVSAERVRDELFQMLVTGWAPRALSRLRDYRLLPVFLPAADLPAAAWQDTLARVRRIHALASDRALPLAVRRRLREVLAGPRPCLALLKWAAVLGAVRGAEDAGRSASRLRLGVREGQLLATLLREEERARALLRGGSANGRELHRFVRSTGGWATETLLFAATGTDVGEPISTALLTLLDGAAAEEAAIAAPLISGVDVMNLLNLPAGPAVGRWLQALAEARAERVITTPAEARAWLLREADQAVRTDTLERKALDGCRSHRADAD